MANNFKKEIFEYNYPANYPKNMSGELSYKVKLKKDYVRADGTCAVYIQLFLNGKKMLPLNISVAVKDWDDAKQIVKKTHPNSGDYNLMIKKMLGKINDIQINCRLSDRTLTMAILMEELQNPTAKFDFIKFWENEMIKQKEFLKKGTYRQQMSVLKKVREFKEPMFFNEINLDLIQDLKTHCKKKLKNTDATVSTTLKSFKKYLHLAQKKGIRCNISFDEIKNKQFLGSRTFLNDEEIKKFFKYWQSEFISETKKNILDRYLFSCFTGLRFTDVVNLKPENFINDTVVFTAEKTGKFQRIPINNAAKNFYNEKIIFSGNYTGEYINRELKEIAKFLGINKNISFHTARHTFATNFLIFGGRVEHLQKILGHSKITDTMIYVHITQDITNTQIFSMDEILK